uniref:Putative intron-encoded maturase n=1 Tax=Nitellopsis obtusa TaxID=40811 RepID=A0A8F6YEP5_9VIRI|nr:putative intron-encoded maturase [Nitellopsis obtusa]
MNFISKNNEIKQGFYSLFFLEIFYTRVSINTNNHIVQIGKIKQSKLIHLNKIFHYLLIKRFIRKIRQQNYSYNNLSEFSTNEIKLYFQYKNQFYSLIIENVLFLILHMIWQHQKKRKKDTSILIQRSIQSAFPFLEQKTPHCIWIMQGKIQVSPLIHQFNCFLLFFYERIRDKIFLNLLKNILNFNKKFFIETFYCNKLYFIQLPMFFRDLYINEFDSFIAYHIIKTRKLVYLVNSNQTIYDFSLIQKKHILGNIQRKKKHISFLSWLASNFFYSIYGNIHYVRRNFSFLIAFQAGKYCSRFWKYNCKNLMQLKLGCSCSLDSLYLRSLFNQNFLFLGYRIVNQFWKKNFKIRGFSWSRSILFFLKGRRISTKMPVFNLIHSLSLVHLCNIEGYPIHKAKWSVLNDEKIINIFSQLWKNILLYYSGCSNRRDLGKIQYILEFSCMKTLAFKHKSSIRSTWKQYNKYLSFLNLVKNRDKNSKISVDLYLLFHKTNQFWLLELYTIQDSISFFILID